MSKSKSIEEKVIAALRKVRTQDVSSMAVRDAQMVWRQQRHVARHGRLTDRAPLRLATVLGV